VLTIGFLPARGTTEVNMHTWGEVLTATKFWDSIIVLDITKVFFIHLFTCAYIVWVISPPCPPPSPSPPNPRHFQAEPVWPLSLILFKRRHKHNKKDRVFLLVEIRIAIQRDSYYCFHVQMCIIKDFNSFDFFICVSVITF
jgi:hypothetical protein